MSIRDLIGYIMGLALFVILIPLIMWKLSGEIHPGMAQTLILCILALAYKEKTKKIIPFIW